MSTKGEIFISDILGEYLREKESDLDFNYLKCDKMKTILSEADFPERIEVLAFYDDYLVATIFVDLKFNIAKHPHQPNQKWIAARIGKVEIIDFEPNMRMNEDGQLICPHCGKAMESISQTQYDTIKWKWDPKDKKYCKQPKNGGESEKCTCDACGEHIGWIGEFLGY